MENKYSFAEDIREKAIKIINENSEFSHIDLDKVVFCRTRKHISGDYVLARTLLLSDITQFLSDKEYCIEFPPVFETLEQEQQLITIEHELMHISPDGGLVPHDIAEFKKIIDKYGIDWLTHYQEAEKKIKVLKEKERLEKKKKKLEEKDV